MSHRLIAVGAVMILCAAAVPVAAAPVELPPPPIPAANIAPQPTPARLMRRLRRLQRFPATSPGGPTGVAVITAAGDRLATTGAGRRLLPASTIKLLTAAAALRVLGPDHRFVTRVYATTPPDDAGVVDGDLIVRGGGDPTLVTPLYRRRVDDVRPATSLRRLARRVSNGGVTRVRGRIAGDGSILADQPLAAGWRDDYLTDLDAAPVAGLTVDLGRRMFRRSGRLLAAPAGDPAARTAHELDRLLSDIGVRTSGRAGVGPTPTATVEVARVTSPPLRRILAHMLGNSDNHLADTVFRMLGAAAGEPTWRGSERAVRAALRDADVAWSDVTMADGSGLSRRNRLTAVALVEVLRSMAASPQRSTWLRLLPVTGRSGTVASRLAGTQGAGRVHAKTGTLGDVRALAGTVPGARGRDHHFAVLANGLDTYAGIVAARRLADVIALALVTDQDGCRRPIAPPEGSGPRRSPERLLCGAAADRGSRADG